jgi:hypothetical protein
MPDSDEFKPANVFLLSFQFFPANSKIEKWKKNWIFLAGVNWRLEKAREGNWKTKVKAKPGKIEVKSGILSFLTKWNQSHFQNHHHAPPAHTNKHLTPVRKSLLS